MHLLDYLAAKGGFGVLFKDVSKNMLCSVCLMCLAYTSILFSLYRTFCNRITQILISCSSRF